MPGTVLRVSSTRACVPSNGVDILPRERGDAAQVLHQVQDHALAAQQHARVVANDGQHLAAVDAHAVEDLRVADDLKACVRLRAR